MPERGGHVQALCGKCACAFAANGRVQVRSSARTAMLRARQTRFRGGAARRAEEYTCIFGCCVREYMRCVRACAMHRAVLLRTTPQGHSGFCIREKTQADRIVPLIAPHRVSPTAPRRAYTVPHRAPRRNTLAQRRNVPQGSARPQHLLHQGRAASGGRRLESLQHVYGSGVCGRGHIGAMPGTAASAQVPHSERTVRETAYAPSP